MDIIGNRLLLLGVLLFGIAPLTDCAKRVNVDKVLATIYHSEGRIVILQSDLRPDLSDQSPTLRDAILKEIIILDAKKFKITVSDADIERHLGRIQESLKKTRDELLEFFKERGYTFDMAKKELEKGLLVETTVGERVKSKALLSEAERKKYCDENPIVNYSIKQAFIPFGLGSKSITRATIDAQIDSGEIVEVASWSDPIALKEKDIAAEKSHIKTLLPGAVAKVAETNDGITLLQLVSKVTVPYEDRKKQITEELGAKRHKKALDDYFDGLMANAHIRYLDKNAH